MKITQKLILVLLLISLLVVPLITSSGCAAPDRSDPFIQLLGMIPAGAGIDENFIIINDYAAIFDAVGISLAELDEQSTTFKEFIDLLRASSDKLSPINSFPTSFTTGWGQYADKEIIRNSSVGYNFASLDAEIQAGSPPHEMTAAIGRYDPEATREALQNQDEWPDWAVEAYATEEYRGVTINTWGDGYEIHLDTPLRPPHIDNLGRARPLVVANGYLLSATGLDSIKAMIDANQGKTENLADLPEYADIVGKMSEFGVFSMLLGNESFANGNPEEYGSYPGPLLKKFLTFATAPGTDENGAFMALVLYHDNPDDAQANVSLLKERIDTTKYMGKDPWNEIVTETDIQAEANLLVAKLYTDQSGLWIAWVYGQDSLVLHEN